MKKIIQGLLATLLAVSSVSAAVSNKTFMADRGTLSNNCIIGTSAKPMGEHKGGLGASVSVAGFYRLSHNEGDLGKYFGDGLTDADRKGTITFTEDKFAYNTSDAGSVSLSPRREEYGVHINWTQCLSKFVKGLSLSVDAPIVHVDTQMRAKYTQTAGTQIDDFFTGVDLATTDPSQAALAYQKHSAKGNSETGVADVEVALNYDFASDADYKVGGSVNFVIPTGNKPAGVWAFEPLYGGKHFYLGAGLNGAFNLWRSEDKKSSLDFNAAVDYKYGFCAKEVRTMGLYNAGGSAQENAGHYRATTAGANVITPLANVATLECDVTPESSVGAVAGLSYRFNRFAFNVSYNLNYNQEETVKVRTGEWDATAHALPAADNDTDGTVGKGSAIGAETATTAHRIDPAAATTPSKVTHKVGGGLDYSFDCKTPITVGLGAEGEFNSNNDSVNSWGVWAKVGFCF